MSGERPAPLVSTSQFDHSYTTHLTAREAERLEEHVRRKNMSAEAVLRQAFRFYDTVENTPGAVEAINLIRDRLEDPKYKPPFDVEAQEGILRAAKLVPSAWLETAENALADIEGARSLVYAQDVAREARRLIAEHRRRADR